MEPMKKLLSILLALLLLLGQSIAACSPTLTSALAGSIVQPGTSASVTFSGVGAGDLIAISVWCNNAGAGCTISTLQDGSGNPYTVTPNSPGATNGNSGQPRIAYRLASGASGTVTVTVTITASMELQIGGLDVALGSGCTATFDTDAAATSAVAHLTTPSVTVAGAGDVLYAFAATEGGFGSGVGGGPWSQGNGNTAYPTTTNADAYILNSSSGSIALDLTEFAADRTSQIVAAFKLSSGGGGPQPVIDKRSKLEQIDN
jgi:hypothetical protein